jgi:hypothetical protein
MASWMAITDGNLPYKTNCGPVREESTGETACRTFLQNELEWAGAVPTHTFLLSPLKGIRDKTNYAAAAVMVFPFAGTGWRRD